MYNPAFVCLLGIGTVFIGLICIIIICKLMSLCCSKTSADTPESKTSPMENQGETIPNRQEFIAAVSAAIAEDMGKDISAIRILSVKKI